MGRIVIAAFKPKSDRQAQLREVVAEHWGILRAEGLVTDRQRVIMQAGDGTLIEVFEWCSAEAVCDCVPLAGLGEAQRPFAEFDTMGL